MRNLQLRTWVVTLSLVVNFRQANQGTPLISPKVQTMHSPWHRVTTQRCDSAFIWKNFIVSRSCHRRHQSPNILENAHVEDSSFCNSFTSLPYSWAIERFNVLLYKRVWSRNEETIVDEKISAAPDLSIWDGSAETNHYSLSQKSRATPSRKKLEKILLNHSLIQEMSKSYLMHLEAEWRRLRRAQSWRIDLRVKEAWESSAAASRVSLGTASTPPKRLFCVKWKPFVTRSISPVHPLFTSMGASCLDEPRITQISYYISRWTCKMRPVEFHFLKEDRNGPFQFCIEFPSFLHHDLNGTLQSITSVETPLATDRRELVMTHSSLKKLTEYGISHCYHPSPGLIAGSILAKGQGNEFCMYNFVPL